MTNPTKTIVDEKNSDEVAPIGVASTASTRPSILKRVGTNYGLLGFLLILIIGFSLWLPDDFPTWNTVQLIAGTQAVPAILALGVILPLVAGEFDLSVGALLGICSVFAAWIIGEGASLGLVIPLTLLIGVAVGIFNGFLVTKIGVGAFIGTLAVATILSGGNLLMTNGTLLQKGVSKSGITDIGRTELFGLPIPFYVVIVLAFLLYYLLEWTPFGRYLQATGTGREAARLSGVRTDRWLFLSFVGAGLIAALAGFLETSQIGSASPTVGPDFLLPAYAAAFLGATVIHPGRFNVWGTLIGILILAVGITGLNLAGAAFWVPPVFNGTALVLAVSFAVIVARRGGARAT